MNNVLILFSKNSYKSKHADPEYLISLFNDRNSDNVYDYMFYEDLVYLVNNNNAKIYHYQTKKDIKNYDLVYHRRWNDSQDEALSCYIYLNHNKVKQVDSELGKRISTNKLTQHWRLWESNLPIPDTVYINGSCSDIKKTVNDIASSFIYPKIVKSTTGTRGSDNFLVKTSDEIVQIFTKYPDKNFLIQQYIRNDGDYRVFVCGDKPALLIRRQSAADGEYRNNISLGGVAKVIDTDGLDKDVIKDCIRAAKVFCRDIAGVDVVLDLDNKDNHYIFEVNRSPQIENSSYELEKIKVVDDYFKSLIGDQKNDK